MQTESDLKAVPRLRWELDEDRSVIARTTSRRNSKDHLYFHGPGVLGWYYERNTKRKAANARKAIERRIHRAEKGSLAADFDGTVLFRASGHADVPEAFLRRLPGPLAGVALKAREAKEHGR